MNSFRGTWRRCKPLKLAGKPRALILVCNFVDRFAENWQGAEKDLEKMTVQGMIDFTHKFLDIPTGC